MDDPRRRLYGAGAVSDLFGFRGKTIYRLIRQGRFPRGKRYPGGQKWSEEDLDAYRLLADRWFPGEVDEDDDEDEAPEKKKEEGKKKISGAAE